jgi:pyruvate/2-oxoglutarate dehydrogenase complex dihydrolipoamide acyltransferase (E2) component
MLTPSRLGTLEAGLQVESNFQEMVMKNVHEVRMPDIGDAKDVGVIEIPVKAGDAVVEGQTLIIVETDKASMEIPSPHTGVLQSLVVSLDDKVSEGSPIAFIESEGLSAAPAPRIAPVATLIEPQPIASPGLLIEAVDPPTDLPLASQVFSRTGCFAQGHSGHGPASPHHQGRRVGPCERRTDGN